MRVPHGYGVELGVTQGWFELPVNRGLAGYGLSRALRMLLDVLDGLSALHDTRFESGQPFVHGEVVPALLRVDVQGKARLVPLAPWHWSAPGTLAVQGRWGHLAPERLLGDALDQRADVFSVGVLLWEALAGRRLFDNEPIDSIVTRLMGGKTILPPLPPELSWAAPLKSIAMCALAVDPEQRFANCAELAEAIQAVAGERLATHAEVAAYFGAPPDRSARPSSILPPVEPTTHHSSLSALVSPVRMLEAAPAKVHEPDLSPRDASSTPPASRGGRRLWGFAVFSLLCLAIGASAITLRDAGQRVARPGVASPVPAIAEPSNASMPVTPLVASAPALSPSASPVVDVAPAVAAAPASTEGNPAPSSDPPKNSTRPSKGAKPAPGGVAPKLKAPIKPARPRDKEADLYGI